MEDKNTFELPNETVIVKFIPRKRGMAANVENNHVIAGGMLVNTTKKFCAPLQRNGAIKNVLTEQEKIYLEKVTGLNLSVYGDFWSTYYVTLFKEDNANVLNLSNPMDYISYKILLACKSDIAPSWQDRTINQSYQFAITRENEEKLEDKKRFDSKFEAFKLYDKIKDNQEQLIGVLKLLSNRLISKDTKLEWLQQEVFAIIDKEPSSFISAMKDKSVNTKMLINSAIDAKVITKKSNRYSTVDGLELCNPGEVATLENTVRYLEDPRNQEVRDIIEAKVSKSK